MITPLFIGAAGGTGSGKSTVVERIVGAIGRQRVTCLPHDAYYHDFAHLLPNERGHVNFDHPDALDTALLIQHLDELRAGNAVMIPVYDFANHTRTERVLEVRPTPVIIVDGILVLAEPEIRERLDIKLFIDTDSDVRFIRRLARDVAQRGRTVDSVIRQYMDSVRPMHLEFVEPSKRYADVIIPVGGENQVAIEIVVAHLRSRLSAEDPIVAPFDPGTRARPD